MNMGGTAWLDKNGLPDSARGRVPAPLLAHRLLVVIHRIFDSEHQPTAPTPIAQFRQSLRQIEFKRRVAALMMAEMAAVAPAVSEKVRRPDRQDQPFTVPNRVIRDFDVAPIPPDLVARSGAMIGPGHRQRIEEDPRGVIILIS